jgi:hypothetical protein
VTSTFGILDAINSLKAAVPQSDVEYGVNLDENSIGLSDTTFAASSGDGKWISFGEGNTKRAFGRDLLLRTTARCRARTRTPRRRSTSRTSSTTRPTRSSASRSTRRARRSASTARSRTSPRSSCPSPSDCREEEHLRPGRRHHLPSERGRHGHAAAERLAFVASANGSIEMIDIAYYDFQRGSLATKYNLYGPLRASLPFPGDDPSVVFKLFGVSSSVSS